MRFVPKRHAVEDNPIKELQKACDGMKDAFDSRGMGDIVAKRETLILEYYKDVRAQAGRSFDSARTAAGIGFMILATTLLYVLVIDGLTRVGKLQSVPGMAVTVSALGFVSGALIEFIAGINFRCMPNVQNNSPRFIFA